MAAGQPWPEKIRALGQPAPPQIWPGPGRPPLGLHRQGSPRPASCLWAC